MYGSRLLKSTIQMACLNPTSVYCSNANEAEQILANYNNENNELQCTVDILIVQSFCSLIEIKLQQK